MEVSSWAKARFLLKWEEEKKLEIKERISFDFVFCLV
jgi:hypothetical protein